MNFFLDENFPKTAVSTLERKGHKVFDIRGTKHEGCSDFTIFDFAQKNKAIFLTTDKDFYHTIQFIRRNHFGIIVIALSQPNLKGILSKLNYALNYVENVEIKSRCLLLKDNQAYLNQNKSE